MPRNDNLTLLFPLRKPFTHAVVKDVKDAVEISLEVDDEYAGTLRVSNGRLPLILLYTLADLNRAAGHVESGRVTWVFDPDVYNYTVVIDDQGVLWDVKKLERKYG